MAKIQALTVDQAARLPEIREKWLKLGLTTARADRAAAKEAAADAYRTAGREPPRFVLWFENPRDAVLAWALILSWVAEARLRQKPGSGDQVSDQVRDQVSDQVRDQVSAQVRAQVSDQVRDQVSAQVRDQVRDQVSAQVLDQVLDQVRDQVLDQVLAQVRDQVLAQVLDQVRAQVSDQVRDQVSDQVSAQVLDQVRDQVSDQVLAQVRDQVLDQVLDQVRDQVLAQVRDQVLDQVLAQVRDQVLDQVSAQVSAQVRDQVSDQVLDQVSAQVRAQVSAQVRAQVSDQVLAQVLDQVKWFADRWGTWWWRTCYGNQEWWLSWHDFFGQVLGLACVERLRPLFRLAETCGWWLPMDGIALMVDRPVGIHRDERGRLHRADGPAMDYSDGWGVWCWHGVRVPQHVIEKPDTITVAEVEGERNAEIRRVMVERFGAAKYLQAAGAKLVHEEGDGLSKRRLWRREEPGDEPIVMVEVLNQTAEPDGTFKTYWLSVHPELRPLLGEDPATGDQLFGDPQELTCHNAVASTFGLRGPEYQPTLET